MHRLPLIVFFTMALVFAVMFARGKDPAEITPAMVGKPLPDFAVPGLASDAMKGKVVVLNLFASWCPSCVIEHAMLAKLAKEQKAPLYGLAYKDQPEATKQWLKKHGNIYTQVGQDHEGRVAIDLGVYGVPETFVVDKHGVIRLKHAGPVTEKVYQQQIKPLLERLEKE